ncbi:MAG: hypothetical protein NUV45_10420 [Tepidanaerobacteraceae bacterium]|jgi:hypothetical protein|nr:hypothetical protein [Tepidanaerobacteraceae bacterium]
MERRQKRIRIIDDSQHKVKFNLKTAERKEDLDRIRGLRKLIDPERGPENKR